MPANAMVGLKLESDSERLIELTKEVVDPQATIHLVTLVRVGKDSDEHERLRQAKKQIEALAAGLASHGYQADGRAELCAISPGTELARIASHLEVDLVVIGLGRRSRVGKALLGSDAQSVLLNAACPVLVARTD